MGLEKHLNSPGSGDESKFGKEKALDKKQLFNELNDLSMRFMSLEDQGMGDTVLHAAVESNEFKSALTEMVGANPERALEMKQKLEAFLEQKERILAFEAELSKESVATEIGSAAPDFNLLRENRRRDVSALEAGKEIAGFFGHPVVSYFTNLLIPAATRKKIADTYKDFVGNLTKKIEKEQDAGMIQAAVTLLPMIRGINQEKRFEIKKEFFGAMTMRRALEEGADGAIMREIEKNGEAHAREIFGDEVFDADDSVNELNEELGKPQSLDEIKKTVNEAAIRWLQKEASQSERETFGQFRRLVSSIVKEQGVDLAAAKDIVVKCIDDLTLKPNLNRAQTVLAYKAIDAIKRFDGKL